MKIKNNPYLKPLCLVIMLGFLSACSGQSADKPSKPVVQAKQLAPVDVAVANIGTYTDKLGFTATLKPLDQAQVAAEVDGMVLSVKVQEGQAVQKGEVLAVLDSQSLADNVKSKAAQVSNQQARLDLARIKLQKQRELYKQGFISKIAIDELESNFRVQEGEYRVQVADLSQAQKSLSDAVVRAPIAGVIYQKMVNAGDVIVRNKPLFSVAKLQTLEAIAQIPSKTINQVQIKQAVLFKVENDSKAWQGYVARINPVANQGSRSFNVYIHVDNHSALLKAGQFIRGQIDVGELNQVTAVPKAAVQEANTDRPWVMIVKAGKLTKMPVTVVLTPDASDQLVIKGLPKNSVYLVTPLIGMQAGDAVSLPKANAAGA